MSPPNNLSQKLSYDSNRFSKKNILHVALAYLPYEDVSELTDKVLEKFKSLIDEYGLDKSLEIFAELRQNGLI